MRLTRGAFAIAILTYAARASAQRGEVDFGIAAKRDGPNPGEVPSADSGRPLNYYLLTGFAGARWEAHHSSAGAIASFGGTNDARGNWGSTYELGLGGRWLPFGTESARVGAGLQALFTSFRYVCDGCVGRKSYAALASEPMVVTEIVSRSGDYSIGLMLGFGARVKLTLGEASLLNPQLGGVVLAFVSVRPAS